MEKKAEMNIAELQKQLESITGQKIEASPEQIRSLFMPLGNYNYEDGSAVWKSFIIFPGKHCSPATLLDVGATSGTDASGKQTLLLSNVICLPQVRSLGEPVNIVATARGEKPCFVTVNHQLVFTSGIATDLQMTFFTWAPGGGAAGNVAFDWRARLVSFQIIG
jgi:hypothetical protein